MGDARFARIVYTHILQPEYRKLGNRVELPLKQQYGDNMSAHSASIQPTCSLAKTNAYLDTSACDQFNTDVSDSSVSGEATADPGTATKRMYARVTNGPRT